MTVLSPAISVIVGSINARASVRACLNALVKQAAAIKAEIVLADASTDGTAEIVAAEFPSVKVLRGERGSLVPHLWRLGLAESSGSIVAFTIAQCIPTDDWLQQILLAHQENIAGIGGPIEGPMDGNVVDWAIYFARYSAYLPPGTNGLVDEIPGDNAAYKRSALDRCQVSMRAGFWETLVHVQLRANGEKLAWDSQIQVKLGSGGSLGSMMAMRFRHGRHYGSTRPGNTLIKRFIRLAASPLIVPTFIARIAGRVRRQRPEWTGQLLWALPALLIILSAWTLGEVTGYLLPQSTG